MCHFLLNETKSQQNLNVIIHLFLTDTPGPVMNLEATDITQTSAMLSWTPPETNGGSDITHYIVEKREIDRKTWATVKAEVQGDKIPFKVSGLMSGTEYNFRVTAVNEYGSGVPRVTPTSYMASDPVSKYHLLITRHRASELIQMLTVLSCFFSCSSVI